MPVSLTNIRRATWTLAFQEGAISVYTNAIAPQITVAHIQHGVRTIIEYRAFGKQFDTIAKAVDHYNEEEKARRIGVRRSAAGSVEALRERKASMR